MAVPDDLKGLRFACECVSARAKGYGDPWANISQNRLLPDGTKEEILNLVAQEPRTISLLAHNQHPQSGSDQSLRRRPTLAHQN